MNKIEALESIRDTWNDEEISLGEKIVGISTNFYSEGLSLAATAAFIKATPAELEALLELSNLDDNIINVISEVNPPKTTWAMLASANEDEALQALMALKDSEENTENKRLYTTTSEYVYLKMIEVSGMSTEQKVANLSGDDLYHVYKKADSFNALTSNFLKKFLPSIAKQKKMGKTLSSKQLESLVNVLQEFAEKGIIKRNSIDGDQDICDRVLDALGKE